MEIDLQTRIGPLLKAYPELEDVLLELSPAFARLRNPVLRRTVANVATVQQAAKIAGISPAAMVRVLRKAAGLAVGEPPRPENEQAEEGRPDWFDDSRIAVRFDAGPVIEAGQSPMQDILRLSQTLNDGEIMELSAPFRPEPIIDILKAKGYKAWYGEGKAYFMR